jgi:membrane protein implicated in regulation of membrane protease activity
VKLVNERIKNPWPSLKGLWSLLWRATLLFPLAALLMTGFFLVWMGVLLLPICAIYFVWLGEWSFMLITSVVWILLFLLTRWKRFRIDPKDDLNGRENI